MSYFRETNFKLGIPKPIADQEIKSVMAGKAMISILESISRAYSLELRMRIGIHCGSAVAGILGEEKLLYDIWSKDVSIAAFMEHTGQPSRVHISEPVRKRLEGKCLFDDGPDVEYEGETIKTYFVKEVINRGNLNSTLEEKQDLENPFATRRSTNSGRLQKDESLSSFSAIRLLSDKRNEKRIHRFYGWFIDQELEEEYQASCVSRNTRKMVGSYALVVVFAFIIFLINITAFLRKPEAYWMSLLGFTICFVVFIYLLLRWRAFQIGDRPILQAMYQQSTFIKFQVLGPASIIILFIVAISQVIRSSTTMSADLGYHRPTISLLLVLCCVFPRLYSFYMICSTFAVVLFDNLILAILLKTGGQSSTVWMQFAANVTACALGWIAVVIISSRFEYIVRKDFLKKKDLLEHKYEVADLRARTEQLLYKLLPRDVIMR
jgi:hypothetical protein